MATRSPPSSLKSGTALVKGIAAVCPRIASLFPNERLPNGRTKPAKDRPFVWQDLAGVECCVRPHAEVMKASKKWNNPTYVQSLLVEIPSGAILQI